MKHYANLAAVCLLFLLSACSTDKKEIETNALGYLNATGNYLIDEAMPYATKETQENALTFLRDKLIPMTPQEYIQSNTPATIVIDNIEIVNDTAHVKYTKTTPIQTLENEIMMVQDLKADGRHHLTRGMAAVAVLSQICHQGTENSTGLSAKSCNARRLAQPQWLFRLDSIW